MTGSQEARLDQFHLLLNPLICGGYLQPSTRQIVLLRETTTISKTTSVGPFLTRTHSLKGDIVPLFLLLLRGFVAFSSQ